MFLGQDRNEIEVLSLEEKINQNPLFKTKICNNFAENQCKNGDKCQYAHGHSELRKTLDNIDIIRGKPIFQI